VHTEDIVNERDEGGEERLLAMAIDEVRGDPMAGLAGRVLQRLDTVAPGAQRWHRLPAAALLVAGLAVVVAVAAMRPAAPAMALAQDPQRPPPPPQVAAITAVEVTDADLPAKQVWAFGGHSALDALLATAKTADLPLVSAVAGIDHRLDAARNAPFQATPRRALAIAAQAVGAHLEQYGAVLTVVPGTRAAEPTVTMRGTARPADLVFAELAHAAGINLVVAPAVQGSIAVAVADADWRDLLDRLAVAVGADVVGLGSVLHLVPRRQAAALRVHFAYDRSAVAKVLTTITKLSGTELLGADRAAGSVSVRATNVPAEDVLAAVAATLDCEVVTVAGRHLWRARTNPRPR
jgi:hypothetical protein